MRPPWRTSSACAWTSSCWSSASRSLATSLLLDPSSGSPATRRSTLESDEPITIICRSSCWASKNVPTSAGRPGGGVREMKGPWIGFFWVPNASLGPVFPVGAAVRRKRGPRAAPVNRRFRPRRGRGGADASVVSCCQHFCYDADAGQPGRASLRLSWGSWAATGGWGYQGRDHSAVTISPLLVTVTTSPSASTTCSSFGAAATVGAAGSSIFFSS
jgi:hypothetical protein